MDLRYDKPLDVATGNSRTTKVWKNKTMRWSELLARMQTTTRTSETLAEYKAMSRAKQADVKDVGGFVGGYCIDGSRSAIRHRSIICLDADFATADLSVWEDWQLIYGNAAALYSTHKHTPEKPRLRLVVPLSRNVDPEEYQAIARRIAADLDIEQFDDTSYQPQRMMYWPSTSQDAQYVFEYIDGPFLDPDTVLTTRYYDWHDVSSWPMSSRVASAIKRTADKQQDPTEKPGLVGAFCRTYTITEAIDLFVPEYQPCGEGRYTYTEGSTEGGVVLYDDKFSYSHHGTDPASMQLCNAWDLVRIHKYHELDHEIDPDTPVSKRPSYKAMTALASTDERVTAQLVTDKMSEAQDDYSEPLPEEDAGDWKARLKITDKGAIASTIENVVIILNGDPSLKGRLAYNELSHNIVTVADLPWRKAAGESQWIDADDADLRYYLERVYGITGKDKIFDGVNVVAMAHKFHPVRDYLATCKWDGIERLDTLLVDYLGADDNPYTRAVTRKALVAAVARIYHPGCKFDYMLTLRGRQGLGKSAIIAKLGGPWFSDSFTTMTGKDAYEQVQGVWLMEVGELAGMRKAEAETIKLYISKQCDRFRPAYGRRLQEFPRQCIFIGTTNESQFLRDTTGNRRFWVVDTPSTPRHDMWEELTPETVAQIWAEAVSRYKDGEKLYLSPAMEDYAREVQESYEEENPRVGIVQDYLDRLLPEGWADMDLYDRRTWLEGKETGTTQRETVCSMEIWAEALGQNPDKVDRYSTKDVMDIMAKIPGWRYQGNAKITARPYGRQRYFKRADQDG